MKKVLVVFPILLPPPLELSPLQTGYFGMYNSFMQQKRSQTVSNNFRKESFRFVSLRRCCHSSEKNPMQSIFYKSVVVFEKLGKSQC